MKKMRIPALLLCGALAVSGFLGCGKNIDKTAVVATAGEKEVTLGLANFAARSTVITEAAKLLQQK